MGPIIIHNGEKYVHAQDSNDITSVRVKIQLNF